MSLDGTEQDLANEYKGQRVYYLKKKGGFSVAIAGIIAFLPFRRRRKKGILNFRFTIESINPKKMNIVVF